MSIRCGDTLLFETPPVIAAGAAVGGKKESEGPLAAEFDELFSDNRFGQSGWEAAERHLQLRAVRLCLKKSRSPAGKSPAGAGRRPAGTVHRFQLCHAGT